jgi:hypothetical protein
MRLSTLAAVSAFLLATSALAQNAPPGRGAGGGTNITGTIVSFDGTTLAIKADADGAVTSAALAPNATITTSQKVKLSDIKPNEFVATGGTLGADGKIHSNEIRIFPEANRGRGEGQFPMAQAGQVMTNATIKQVVSVSDGGTMKMSFKGSAVGPDGKCTGRAPTDGSAGCTGETEIQVAPDVPVVRQAVADKSALKAGTKATVNVANGPDGAPAVSRVTLTLN